MPNKPNQKLRLLCLIKIMFEKTDSEYGLTTQQLIDELACHGLDVERKALYRDMHAMRDFGLKVEQRYGKKWYLASRPIDMQEMIMLLDAVQSSPFLTDEMTEALIGRIQGLASLNQRKMLARRIEVPGRVKTSNAEVLRNLDTIQQAMRLKRNVEFHYFHYDMKKHRVLNSGGKVYSVTPVRLIYADELYYLVSFMEQWADVEGHQPFAPYRVDRMIDVHVSEKEASRDPRIASWRSEERLSPGFGIFATKKAPVVLEFDQGAMNPIIDKFGLDAIVFEMSEDRAKAYVKAPLSPQFFGWLLQLGTMVRITHPKQAVEQFTHLLDETRHMYADQE